MAKHITLSGSLQLPLDAVTQTLACIGRKGAGKTYLAGVIAEQMLDAGAQVAVIDPVGNWWGLRLAADGVTKGKHIFIAGGERGDVPILPDSGSRFARLIVEKNISIVLDVSGFRQGERKRFAADFAEEFFHLKKSQRSAVHLFVEEAQLFAPQRVGPDEARMLGAFENIIRLGRNYGIGATLITQRPQSVNKEVLSQVECLCVLQVNGAHERKALDEWIQEFGADRSLVGKLPGLGQGEGYVWSPSWLRVFQRMHFSSKTTFNASATPELGKTAKTGSLSKMDVDELKQDLQQVIESAAKDDPKALRKRIAELEKTGNRAAAPDPEIVRSLQARVWELESYSESLAKQIDSYAGLMAQIERIACAIPAEIVHAPAPRIAPPAPSRVISAPTPPKRPMEGFDGPQSRVLSALAELQAVGIMPAPRQQVAVFAGYTNLNSKGLVNALGSLRTERLIDYPESGWVALTVEGLSLAPDIGKPKTEGEFHDRLMGMLGGPESRILRVLIDARGESISRPALAGAAGYSNLTSKGFVNSMGRLRTLGLLDYPATGQVAGTELLFFRGRR